MLRLNQILFIIYSFLFITKCRTKDYCSPDYCHNSRQHTLCKYPPDEEPAKNCLSFERTITSVTDKRLLLDKINARRNKVASGEIRSLPPAAGMSKLEWNSELEQSAQRWADQCVSHRVPDLKDTCRDLGNTPVGQNIATVQGDSPGLTPMALVDVWYMELLKLNSSVISRYIPSSDVEESHYDYFTQLVWEDSTEVGCGGVKFQERLGVVKYRTIYRLVCNFAPGGNRRNKTVYSCGSPCSACSDGVCDHDYKALCDKKPTTYGEKTEKDTYDEDISTQAMPLQESTKYHNVSVAMVDTIFDAITISKSDLNSEKEYFTFDYFSHLHDPNIVRDSSTTKFKDVTNKDALIDEVIEMLKKKLNKDPSIKDLLFAPPTGSMSVSDMSFHDEGMSAFLNRIYSKASFSTTTTTAPKDYVNSTLLVDLIEAVIFRSNDKISTTETYLQDTQTLPIVKPVKVQAELAEVKDNREFSGHYFFPEEEEVESTTEITEIYYDNTNVAQSDVEIEIEYLKMSSMTRDFLDDIFETDTSTESTRIINTLSPDDLNLYKRGYKVMKKFLEREKIVTAY